MVLIEITLVLEMLLIVTGVIQNSLVNMMKSRHEIPNRKERWMLICHAEVYLPYSFAAWAIRGLFLCVGDPNCSRNAAMFTISSGVI